MLLDLVALESRFKILLGDTPFVSFLPEQLVISRFPSNFREIFLTGFLLTGGNFVESRWGSDICPTRMGIFLHVNLYSCIWSVENILCGGHHVTTAFDVLRDRCLTLTKVRFSGGPRTGKERRIGSVWKMVDFKSSLKSPCLSWLCKRNQLSEMVMHPAAKSDQVANGFICWSDCLRGRREIPIWQSHSKGTKTYETPDVQLSTINFEWSVPGVPLMKR